MQIAPIPNSHLRYPTLAFAISLALSVSVPGLANAAEVVAIGASSTYGHGVDRGDDYPSQLEKQLRARGFKVAVANAGIDGDTTAGMLSRLDGVLGSDTKVLVVQTPANDPVDHYTPEETKKNIDSIWATAHARHIKVVLFRTSKFHFLPHLGDGKHLTPEGYRAVVESLLPQVIEGLRH